MIALKQPTQKEEQLARKRIPRLENGDRLTRAEFERRYAAMPSKQKAELIEGTVYMSSPVNHKAHGEPHANLLTMLGVYRVGTPGTELSDNATVRLDLDNEPQPDVLLRIVHSADGASIIDEDGYIQGAPELIVEIANSTASYDMHGKLNAYRRNGVREYLVWLVEEQTIIWFVLNQGEFTPLTADAQGILKSSVFPGLWLNINALLAGELSKALETVQSGLKSPEHKSFVSRLKQKKEKSKEA